MDTKNSAPCAKGDAPDGGQLVAAGHGRDPKTSEFMEVRRAGNDTTFSAPKSISIAYVAAVEGVKEAHDAAVLSVLDHMERHYCHYRHAKRTHPGGMVAATFDHAALRSIHLQLLSNIFLANAVKTPRELQNQRNRPAVRGPETARPSVAAGALT
ncbi:relaxase domain-containing protein [Geomonas oryzisoli]|uniref:relaxase domain-containing protein n=1 Tax=Geomonas oryzisoli TaxID=2847992 RepID=UPI001EEFAF47|nr:relaxase domain-containing protein [Geomonas oryzisoli]